MRVQLTNAIGLDEAGIDGGGIFREFLSELLKTSFDPNRGFFRLTHDNLLFPNPGVACLVSDFPKHYYFIGRILGKVSPVDYLFCCLFNRNSIQFNGMHFPGFVRKSSG